MRKSSVIGRISTLVLFTSVFLATTTVRAQEAGKEPPKEDYVKAHYTKDEDRIPMRDGKRLFTSVYVPKDDSQPYPILMDRTPYSVAPHREDAYKKSVGPPEEFQKA